MRTFLFPLVPACLVLGMAGGGRAAEAQAIINRAIQAHGGADRIDRFQAEEKHTTGTMYRQGVAIPFTQEIFYQRPSQFKQVMTLQGAGQTVTITTILNGNKGWLHVGDKTQLLEEALLAEAKEAAYLGRVTRLTSLKERDFDLTPLGESQVNGRTVWGVKVRSQGY
ncbi:MAG: hypothetical protein JO112_20860, partial [Planctomycetes bacterium]|nr:hypothetical protein [Planctomycetota bacterium]